MTDHRASFDFECKSFDEEQRILRGTATTPNPDRVDDIVEPLGLKFEEKPKLFLNHDQTRVVGTVKFWPPTKAGVDFEAKLPKVTEPGLLRDRVDEAWHMVKYGLIDAVSIGFRPVADKVERLKTGGLHYLEAEVFELSLVGVGANADARITGFKSADVPPRAPGDSRQSSVRLEPSLPLPGAHTSMKGNAMSKTALEQIKDLESTRAAKAAQMLNVMNKSGDAGRSTDENEADEARGLDADIRKIDDDLVLWRRAAEIQAAQAKEVEAPVQRTFGAPMVLRKSRDEDEKFKGQNFTRMIIAKAIARLDDCMPSAVAQQRWGKTAPTLVEIIKVGEVAGGGSGSGEWGAELVTANNRFTGDFIEYLYSKTVFDQLPLRQIPANVQVKGQDGFSTGYWVGESKAIPVTTADFSAVNLGPLKVAALAVCSNELLRDSTPAAEQLVRESLVEASAQKVDTTFLSAAAAVATVSPAGILNGLVAITPSGTDGDALRADIKSLYAPFITAKNAGGLWFVTTPSLAKSIQMSTNALGQFDFPGMNNGTPNLAGDPIVWGDNVGAGDLILLKPSDIYRIGDTGVQVSLSREAMIEQSTTPTGATDTPVAASAAFTSMFQEESTAIKVVRSINWAKRRASAVAFIDAGAYV